MTTIKKHVIRVQLGYRYMLLEPTPKNLQLVGQLANETMFDDVYTDDYKTVYAPCHNSFRAVLEEVEISDTPAEQLTAEIEARRAAKKAAEAEANSPYALVEAAE